VAGTEFTTITWAGVAVGDVVRHGGALFRVDELRVDGADLHTALTSERGNPQRGTLRPDRPVDVRTRHKDALTAAGRRLDGLSAGGATALRDLLGAEMIAARRGADEFLPYVCAASYAATGLASHLTLFHRLHTGDVKTKDGPALREIHREFHAATGPALSAREPHIHNDEAFRKELP
jgi:hypothetical protein